MDITEKILKYLKEKYSPDIILLGGSRAKNSQRDTSDWDLYLIGDYKNYNKQISDEFCDEFLDIALFSKKLFNKNKNILEIYYGPLENLKLLLDDYDNLGLDIIKSTNSVYKLGPKQITNSEKLDKFNYLTRILSKIIGYKHNSLVCNFFIGFIEKL